MVTYMRNAIRWIVDKAPELCVSLLVMEPLTNPIIDFLRDGKLPSAFPYQFDDIRFIVVSLLVYSIYRIVAMKRDEAFPGDESKIILNRNETDYYEIWSEIKHYQSIKIEAIGHSFNTLWFNFLKKVVYEAIEPRSIYDRIEITLISTGDAKASFGDIRKLYDSLDKSSANKVKFNLVTHASSTMFFTGLAVNRNALWLSLREPHKVIKSNEHVREWRRTRSASSAQVLNWYGGIVDHLVSVSEHIETLVPESKTAKKLEKATEKNAV